MTEMETVEGSLKQMGENVSAVQAAAVPGLTKWGQDSLDECRRKWDSLSKQVGEKKNFLLLIIDQIKLCEGSACQYQDVAVLDNYR